MNYYTDVENGYFFFPQEFKQIDILSLSLAFTLRSQGCFNVAVVLFEVYRQIMAHHLLKIPFKRSLNSKINIYR